MDYKIPKILLKPCMSNKFVIDNQASVFMSIIIGGIHPSGYYFYKEQNKPCNKIVVFLDSVLMAAKFKKTKFVEKLCETITHEIAHSHVRQEYKEHFIAEEKMVKSFARRVPDPKPIYGKKKKCWKCGRQSFWRICHLCSKGLLK